jgi:hypothetical protein
LLAFVLLSVAGLSGCSPALEEYVSEEGKFRVRMPAQPTLVRDPELPSNVKKVSLLQRSGSYEVAWEDLPASDASDDRRLDDACDGALKALQPKDVNQDVKRKEITLAGRYPGRELAVKTPDGKLVQDRMYLVKRRLYQVVVSGSKWWVESPASQKVLDSFEVIEE